MSTRVPVSPLRYPGAKRWMSGYISRSIDRNNLLPALFVEPFAGGASVALAQLAAGLVEKVILNDRDPLIAAFWKTVFFDTDWLVDRIEKADVTLAEWSRLKIQKPQSVRALAYKCLFLNRTSFSGVLTDSAGPIGGKAQTSDFKIDCRFTKETIIRRIETIAKYSKRVAFVWNLPWRSAIARVQQMQARGSLPSASLYYLDPPFYQKGNALYRHFFSHNDHLRLRNFLLEFDDPWILSYDACPDILKMYREGGFRASDVNIVYTASQKSKRSVGREIIISNLTRMVSELQLGVGKTTSAPKNIPKVKDSAEQIRAHKVA